MPSQFNIKRENQVIERDSSRVITRLFIHGGNPARVNSIIDRITQIDDQEVQKWLDQVLENFSDKHENLNEILDRNFQQINSYTTSVDYSFSQERERLIGAYFTMEYAVESAALFNPSIVPHPDQTGVAEDNLRFIMSLRAVGEGHVSSIVFRSGIINKQGKLKLNSVSPYLKTPETKNPAYEKKLFYTKLEEMNVCNKVAKYILKQLPDHFEYDDLKKQITKLSDHPKFSSERQQECFNNMRRLADSNYELHFKPGEDLSERVIFPVSEQEKGGIEDARFVPFKRDNGSLIYYATYTAYDGKTIISQLIETEDFDHFKISTLNGKAIQNKDLALFPRKINGRYAMLARQDGENNYIMFSDNINFWHKSEIIQRPCEPWELIQIGNCGSPIETSRGWLVLTHGVGPMRTYSIGAILLDLDDPSKVIAKLEEPLIKPIEQERIGYVPNVVYTCGAIINNDQLVIPYSMSDIQPAVARIEVEELLNAMKKH